MLKSQTGGGDSYAVSARMPPLPLSPVKDLSFRGVEFATDGGTTNILEVKFMANCENCKGKDAHAPESVPYIVHESSMARMERQIKRLWIALLVAVCLLFASNSGWLFCWMQYDYSSDEIVVEQDAQDGGNANYIGNDGDIVNGLPESDSSEAQTD